MKLLLKNNELSWIFYLNIIEDTKSIQYGGGRLQGQHI